MRTYNKVCSVCGKEYAYCTGCGFSEPSYKKMCCSESCRDIYRTLSAYNAQNINEKEAIKRLKNCDLSRLDKFTPNIKKEVQALLAKEIKEEPKPVVNVAPSVKEPEPKSGPQVKKDAPEFSHVAKALGGEMKK